MPVDLPGECRALLTRQLGVFSRRQGVSLGIDDAMIDNQLRTGRWQRLHRGVYATFTGPVPRAAGLVAALLRAGPGATLSHYTAAELYQVADRAYPLIHLTVPEDRHVYQIPGLVIHRSSRIAASRHPLLTPSRTRIEATILDLVEMTGDFDDAFGWLCRAVSRGRTTQDRLRATVLARRKLRWRGEIMAALADIAEGARSQLERGYLRKVERAHRLPAARRQAPKTRGSRSQYLDNLYEELGIAVELDGQAAHPPDKRWADIHRDNFFARSGIITLRYSWADVTDRPCWVAAELSQVLRQRGWPGFPHPCGPACPIPPPAPGRLP